MTVDSHVRDRARPRRDPQDPHFASPRLPEPFVDRARLRTRLDEAAPGALVLVSAAMGYGKTALVADWIANARPGRSPIWVSSLPGEDRRRFWLRLIGAFGSVDMGLRADDHLAAVAAAHHHVAGPVRGFLDALGRRQPSVTLVIDDYHELHDGADCCEPLRTLLDELPISVQLVVISRGEPVLPLPRLRVQGRLHEVRADELAFTRAETEAFLEKNLGPRGLRPTAIATLHNNCSAESGRSSGRIHAPVCTTSSFAGFCQGASTGSAAIHGRSVYA